METGETPSVLAITHGAGDPKRDHVYLTFLDDAGHLREQHKLDNLSPESERETGDGREVFIELLMRRRPQVIVVGGFSPATRGLMQQVTEITTEVSARIERDDDAEEQEDYTTADDRTRQAAFECIYVNDEVARIYQNSVRAGVEFPDMAPIVRYCVALARYAQNPLLEYAALGPDLASIVVHPSQKFVRLCSRCTSSLQRD
jgi:transcription elongation factor SPT6